MTSNRHTPRRPVKQDTPAVEADAPVEGAQRPSAPVVEEGAQRPSRNHAPRQQTSPDDALLDAAREAIVAVGWRRTTLTDVARRAGVSRMTLYRRWPDMQTLLADLMTREWSALVLDVAQAPGTPGRRRVAEGVAATVAALRGNELFAKIVQVDPELLLPYLLDRRGRTQDAILELLAGVIADGQADGSVRGGDPALLARTLLLSAHGFAISAGTMTGEGTSLTDLDAQLGELTDRYLAP